MHEWRREEGVRLAGSRPIDKSKVQAPCVVRLPDGRYRLFYTGVGPGRPFPECQGYILSATSDDGLHFEVDPGIRVAPDPAIAHMRLRVLVPSITQVSNSQWRMYFESRGQGGQTGIPTVICSAVSSDLHNWELDEGVRFAMGRGVGGPRYVTLPNGRGRLYCFSKVPADDGPSTRSVVVSATTSDGLHFIADDGTRLSETDDPRESSGISAAAVVRSAHDERWIMYYSAWQDVPPGHTAPRHPSLDPKIGDDKDRDFAAESIASDIAGYRSRIFRASSDDGLLFSRVDCVLDGAGYESADPDGVHAEDMSVVSIDDGHLRMYYAACDATGHWRILSARTV